MSTSTWDEAVHSLEPQLWKLAPTGMRLIRGLSLWRRGEEEHAMIQCANEDSIQSFIKALRVYKNTLTEQIFDQICTCKGLPLLSMPSKEDGFEGAFIAMHRAFDHHKVPLEGREVACVKYPVFHIPTALESMQALGTTLHVFNNCDEAMTKCKFSVAITSMTVDLEWLTACESCERVVLIMPEDDGLEEAETEVLAFLAEKGEQWVMRALESIRLVVLNRVGHNVG